MEMTNQERTTLMDGIGWLIRVQEAKIEEIKERTEADYSLAISLQQFKTEPFSLSVEKERDIQKVRKEIDRLNQLSQKMNDGSHQIWVVPNALKLAVTPL